jgi:anti-sigma factor RsiW
VRARFAEYLDGRLTGREMQRIGKHLESCGKCTAEFEAEQRMLRALASLGPVNGPVKEPEDSAAADSCGHLPGARATPARDSRGLATDMAEYCRPIPAAAVGGFCQRRAFAGHGWTVLVGMFARPEPASAQDEPLGMATARIISITPRCGAGCRSDRNGKRSGGG